MGKYQRKLEWPGHSKLPWICPHEKYERKSIFSFRLRSARRMSVYFFREEATRQKWNNINLNPQHGSYHSSNSSCCEEFREYVRVSVRLWCLSACLRLIVHFWIGSKLAIIVYTGRSGRIFKDIFAAAIILPIWRCVCSQRSSEPHEYV